MVGKYKEDYDYFDFEKCYQFLELRSRVKLRFVTYVTTILGLSKPVDGFFFLLLQGNYNYYSCNAILIAIICVPDTCYKSTV